MTIKRKLFISTLSYIVLFVLLLSFILFNMLAMKSANEDFVPVMLNVQQLEADMKTVKQSVANFSYSMTDAQRDESYRNIENIETLMAT